MAAPADTTIQNLNGTWVLVRHPISVKILTKSSTDIFLQNKTLSTDTDAVLALVSYPSSPYNARHKFLSQLTINGLYSKA